MKLLFEYASAHPRAIIFIDEIDLLMNAKTDTEEDASLKLKSAFLTAFDGVLGAPNVLVLGTTNRPKPWILQQLDVSRILFMCRCRLAR